jgi:hypothetical protein
MIFGDGPGEDCQNPHRVGRGRRGPVSAAPIAAEPLALPRRGWTTALRVRILVQLPPRVVHGQQLAAENVFADVIDQLAALAAAQPLLDGRARTGRSPRRGPRLLGERVRGGHPARRVGRPALTPLRAASPILSTVDERESRVPQGVRDPVAGSRAGRTDGSRGGRRARPGSGAAGSPRGGARADLNHFYRALLTGKLLSPGLLAQMKTTVPPAPATPEAGGYGLGLFWLPMPCGRAWGHNGGVIGRPRCAAQSRRQSPGESRGEPHLLSRAEPDRRA